jgi:hypothetical protein
MFPPYLGNDGAVRIVSRDLPGAFWGAVIGLAVGGAQAWALRWHMRRPLVWTAVTTLAVGIGIPLGLATANAIGGTVGRLGCFTGVALLGTLVGVAQSLLLRYPMVSSLKWTGASAFAVTAGLLTGITCDAVFRTTPRSWLGLALGFVVYPAVIGFVMGLLTLRPLAVGFTRDRALAD